MEEKKSKKIKDKKRPGAEKILIILAIIAFVFILIFAVMRFLGIEFFVNQGFESQIKKISSSEKIEETAKILESTKADHPDMKKLNLEIKLGPSDFKLEDKQDATKLFYSEASYNYADVEPFLDEIYTDEAYLAYRLDEDNSSYVLNWSDLIAKYNLYLTDSQMPTVLDINVGSGDGEIKLGRNTLEKASLDVGSGDLDFGLFAPNRTNMEMDFNVESGTFDFTGLAYANLSSLNGEYGSGDVVLDFSGDTDNNLVATAIPAEIKGGAGNMNIKLPDNYSYEISYKIGSGNVKINEKEITGTGEYKPDNYDDAEFKIDFNVILGSGSLTIEGGKKND